MANTKKTVQQKSSFEVTNIGTVARINIVGEIGWWSTSGERFIRLVDELLDAGVLDVEGYVNSPGGSMDDANEIGNQIKRFPGSRSCQIGSLCASAGTTVTTYFEHDKITGSPNMQYMIHDPIMKPLITRVKDFKSNQALYENLRNDAIRNYVNVTKSNQGEKAPTKEQIDQMMEDVTWMNAEQAKSYGFIASISGEPDELMPEDTTKVLTNLYADLKKQKGEGLAIPETVNSLLSETDADRVEKAKEIFKQAKKEIEKALETDKNSNQNLDMENNETILKNRLIMAFALTSVTESSKLEDVVNAALASNKAAVELTTAIAGACGVSLVPGESQESVVNQFKAVLKAKDRKITELEEAQKTDDAAKMKAVLDIAEKEGRTTPEGRKKLEAIGEKSGIKALMELIETMPKRTKLNDQLDDTDDSDGHGSTLADAVYARMARMDAQQTKS